jgi:glycerol-3-phosphate dehydrogenase
VRPLAVTGKGGETDWLMLSRKHVVEVDEERAHVSIFGGKLTDCLNVGEEICAVARRLGVALPAPRRRWYGEPDEAARDAFFAEAAAMSLDAMTSPRSSEKLSTRLWRRYGAEAPGLLARIREDPRMGEVLIERAEYLRCEIELAARREMIAKLEDFLRRRSKISLVIGFDDLAAAPGLLDACRILFGDLAEAKLAEYLRDHGPPVSGPGRGAEVAAAV